MSSGLEIVYEDDDLLALNKPAGVLSEGSLNGRACLLDMASAYLGKPAIAYHRLDRLTSGVMLFGKTRRFNKQLADAFAQKRIRKEYWAIVEAPWPRSVNRMESHIVPSGNGVYRNSDTEGKPALTTFRVIKENSKIAWLAALPKTGRTHQIRLHCAKIGKPILGDTLYGNFDDNAALALHARSLSFRHPGNSTSLEIVADEPSYWKVWLESLKGGDHA